jgi:hypothetical protein
MYNGYHGVTCIIWQGIIFPDGMIILEGPQSGYNTDIMVWSNSIIRVRIRNLMNIREEENRQRLKLYADKIYIHCDIITPAHSERLCRLQIWQRNLNFLMSKS